MKIAVFIMNEVYNDNEEINQIRDEYFCGEFKENGIYRVPKRRYRAAFNADIVLFKYKGMYIAQAKSCIDYGELDEKEKIGKLTHFYKFDTKSIKLIPPIQESIMESFFEEKISFRNWIIERKVKKGQEKNIKKILELGDKNSLLKSVTWKKSAKKIELGNLLKEINLYNYENIHTAFFSNFIDENNIYNLKEKPINDFLEILKSKDKKFLKISRIESFEVYYQKAYKFKYINKYIIPDITIDINDKYRIIIEAKVSSCENVYKLDSNEEIKQSFLYWSCFEGKREDFIPEDKFEYYYVFLSMNKTKVKNYTNVTFKEICNNIYNRYEKCKNYNILNDYLRSFHYLCDKKYGFNIDEIPNINLFSKAELKKIYNDIKTDIKDIVKYNKSGEIKDKSLVNDYKYLLVLIYNLDLSDMEKEEIVNCYNLLV